MHNRGGYFLGWMGSIDMKATKRAFLALTAVFFSVPAVAASWQVHAVARPDQSSTSQTIRLAVVVTDENGASVDGLRPENFEASPVRSVPNATLFSTVPILTGVGTQFFPFGDGKYMMYARLPSGQQIGSVWGVGIRVGQVSVIANARNRPPQRIFNQRAATVVPIGN